MNKRFWVNIIIGMLAKPVDMILVYTKVSVEIRCLWLGVALACCVNGIVNFFCKRIEVIQMKDDTKELLEYIISQFDMRRSTERKMSPAEKESAERFNNLQERAQKFLRSIPEIERKLCFGGYIQDCNGIPCCHGDKVMYKNKEYTLQWSQPYSRFFLKAGKSVRDIWDFGRVDISKVLVELKFFQR